ncbi:hypothetical protein CC2G_014575 [Coprinopsis cinerea AmutBmut pab1-1]|nr:hypothetical protein CC2G_014575 [Coprinopsis cinerea AmutBmut pab1-1]
MDIDVRSCLSKRPARDDEDEDEDETGSTNQDGTPAQPNEGDTSKRKDKRPLRKRAKPTDPAGPSGEGEAEGEAESEAEGEDTETESRTGKGKQPQRAVRPAVPAKTFARRPTPGSSKHPTTTPIGSPGPWNLQLRQTTLHSFNVRRPIPSDFAPSQVSVPPKGVATAGGAAASSSRHAQEQEDSARTSTQQTPSSVVPSDSDNPAPSQVAVPPKSVVTASGAVASSSRHAQQEEGARTPTQQTSSSVVPSDSDNPAEGEGEYHPSLTSETETAGSHSDHPSDIQVAKKKKGKEKARAPQKKRKDEFVPTYRDDLGPSAPLISPELAQQVIREVFGKFNSTMASEAGGLVEAVRDMVTSDFRSTLQSIATRIDDLKGEVQDQRREYKKIQESHESLLQRLNNLSAPTSTPAPGLSPHRSSEQHLNIFEMDWPSNTKTIQRSTYSGFYIKRVLLKLQANDELDEEDVRMDLDNLDDDDEDDDDPILKHKPITDQEHRAWCDKSPNRIRVTVENFRYDFTRQPTDVFNRGSIHIGIKAFKREWDKGTFDDAMGLEDEEERKGLGAAFLTYRSLQYSFDGYFKNLSHRYLAATTESGREALKLKRTKAARNTRLTTLTKHRQRACDAVPVLKTYLALLKMLGNHATSEDESDFETVGDTQVKVYRTIAPGWRSKSLEKFLHFLDWVRDELQKAEGASTKSKLKTAKRRRRDDDDKQVRVPGGPRRPRIPSNKVNNNRRAATGLNQNCYSKTWLRKQPEHVENRLLIQKEDFKFPADYDQLKKSIVNEGH